MPETDRPAPDFSLPSDDGSVVTLSELRGSKVVLYFYPKDDTPGCTKEACDLRDTLPQMPGTVVLGVSTDSVESHRKFRARYKLPFRLLADTEHSIADLYGVWQKKKNFGIVYNGIVRTTFIIDAKGVLRHILPVRRVAGHAERVRELVSAMK